jgi:class 3 adenylate cyclase/tetratricopeptide (TPR) repeat protein
VYTFLGTDIVGSLSHWQRDEAAMSVALARHDQILREVVARHGGHVFKGSGDGVWAVFPEPGPALDAALTIQSAMRSTSWGTTEDLRVRVAVHSGGAEFRDGDFYGQTPNLLSRLIERVRGGQILVSEATVQRIDVDVATASTIRSVGELRLRGLRETTHAFELVQPGGDADGASWQDVGQWYVPSYSFPIPGQLVGRARELAGLWAVLEQGREAPQVALISAPAGTGKSTLVGELVRRAQATGTLCLAGGAYEQAGVIPLGPIREALADYLLSQPADSLHALLGDALADLALVMPEITRHLGSPERGEGRPDLDRLSGAVFACLRALAEEQPVLLCLEDLHSTDDGTLGLIRYVMRRAGKLRLVLCLTFRGEEVLSGQELERLIAALTREGAVPIDLAPFDRDQTGELIASLLEGPASERLRDLLYATTEGNPLFLEQSVLALREQGKISRAGRVWHDTVDVELSLTTVSRGLLGERLSRLSRRCHATVAMAAVLGQTFEYDALIGAVAPTDILHLVEDLEEAERAHVLREMPSGYAFTHALLRRALYDSLSAARRRWLHGQVGESIERLAGSRTDEYAAELAYHFSNAGTDRALRAKALQYSLAAGRHADRLFLHHEALEHFKRVCDLVEREGVDIEPEVHLEVLTCRQAAERGLGYWLPVIATCERILTLTDDPLKRAIAHTSIGQARQRVGDMAAAERSCDAASKELEGLPDRPEVAALRLQILADKGYLLFLQGRYDEQFEIGAVMLPVARQLGELGPIQRTHNMIATAAQGSGQLDLALEHFSTSLALTIRAGDRLVEALAHSNLGILYQYRGEFEQARVELTRALDLRRELGAERRDINTLQRLGWVSLGEGDLETAIELGERARDLATRASDRWAADCHDLLGTIRTLQTAWSAATSHFEEAVALRQHGPHVVGRVQTLLGYGTLRQQTGDRVGARELYTSALDIANSITPSPWLVAARRQLGRLDCLAGASGGLELIRAAVDLAETMPRSIQYGATLLAAVECGLWRDDRDSALNALERALASGLTAEIRIDVLCALARYQIEAYDLAAGEQRIVSARALVERLGTPRARCVLLEVEGLLAAAQGDAQAASAVFDRALALAHETGLAAEQTRLAAVFEASGARERLKVDPLLAETRRAREQLGTA